LGKPNPYFRLIITVGTGVEYRNKDHDKKKKNALEPHQMLG
jgi:hypothetical protein